MPRTHLSTSGSQDTGLSPVLRLWATGANVGKETTRPVGGGGSVLGDELGATRGEWIASLAGVNLL